MSIEKRPETPAERQARESRKKNMSDEDFKNKVLEHLHKIAVTVGNGLLLVAVMICFHCAGTSP